MTNFLCSHCGSQLRLKPGRSRASGKCPRCRSPIEWPGETGRAASTDPESRDAIETVDSSRPGELDFLAPPQAPDEIGRLGNYRVLKLLGQGGMGLVLLAEDVKLGRPVALKVMKKAQAAIAVNRVRFLREAQTAAQIEHDHIVTIYQVDEDRGVPFIAMKLLVGETLEDRLNRENKLAPDEVIRIGQEVAMGLAVAHEAGLIHRDIKPANIWLEEGTGRVKLLDFGLARACDEDIKLTQDNYLVGTPMYMSPEQAEGDQDLDARSDLFSLGGVLYRSCTGELPFKGKSTLAVLTALVTKRPRPPHEVNRDVPTALSAVIMDLLSKDPSDRPKSARAVIVALQEALEAPDGYEEVEEEEVLEELEEVAEPRPRRKHRRPVRPARRSREPETAEERLGRRVIWFGIIAAIAVFLLLAALIVQRTFFPQG